MKTAYLTIDDSPSATMSNKLNVLSERNIEAIFFCEGMKMEKDPEPVIEAIQQGFIIGNHSYSHPNFSKISTSKCIEEIDRTDQIIDDLYKQASVERPIKLFRYPYGIKANYRHTDLKVVFRHLDGKFKAIEKFLKKKGYESYRIRNPKIRFPEIIRMWDTDVYWTTDIREWKLRKPNLNLQFDYVEKRVDQNLSYKNGNEIFLLHDHDETDAHFGEIIDLLLNKGFEFKPIIENNASRRS